MLLITDISWLIYFFNFKLIFMIDSFNYLLRCKFNVYPTGKDEGATTH
jgi:hypothetical protein